MEVVIYNKIIGWLVNGVNVKCSGERRKWTNAKLTGKFRLGVRGDKQLEVVEDDNFKKWLSLTSFTGTIGDVRLVEGKRPDEQKVFEW